MSGVYEEPKRLVDHGLATATSEHEGKRPRTVYAITDEGRVALADWLGQSSSPPRLESEGLVRPSFADAGSVDDALANLSEFKKQVDELHERLHGQLDSYLAPGHGPFPERLHIIALDSRFFHDYTAMLQRWADWATEQVAQWPSTNPGDQAQALAALRQLRDEHEGDAS